LQFDFSHGGIPIRIAFVPLVQDATVWQMGWETQGIHSLSSVVDLLVSESTGHARGLSTLCHSFTVGNSNGVPLGEGDAGRMECRSPYPVRRPRPGLRYQRGPAKTSCGQSMPDDVGLEHETTADSWKRMPTPSRQLSQLLISIH
jgi:hypothetical protein